MQLLRDSCKDTSNACAAVQNNAQHTRLQEDADHMPHEVVRRYVTLSHCESSLKCRSQIPAKLHASFPQYSLNMINSWFDTIQTLPLVTQRIEV